MKKDYIINFYKKGNITIPLYFLERYKDLKINMEEFLVLMYLYNVSDDSIFDPDKFSRDLSITVNKFLELIDKLMTNGLLEIKTIKDSKGKMQEVIKLDGFYDKLVISEALEHVDYTNNDIFNKVQKEFGRTLSPVELEIIKAWLENGNSEEIIEAALKEASINRVTNIRYIDKILYDWGNRGIKTLNDLQKYKKPEINNVDVDEEMLDYDWTTED